MAVRRAIAGMAAALAYALASADSGCSKPISITSGVWAPYNYVDAQGRYTGLDVEMSRLIMREAGCTLVELDRMPPIRNTFMFDHGKADMMAGASRTLERSRSAFFSVAYRSETVRLFAPSAEVARWSHVRSFADVVRSQATILAPRVGWYGEEYAVHQPELKAGKRLFQFNEFPDGIKMLAAGRASLILGDEASVQWAAAQRGIKLEALPFWLLDAPVHLMFSKQTVTESDVRRVDAAIERLRRRGVLERLRRAYGNNLAIN